MKIKFFIIFLFVSTSCFSQYGIDSVRQMIDSGVVVKKNMLPADSILKGNYTTENPTFPKSFSKDIQKKYKGEEFNYETIKPHESLWERIQRRIAKFLKSIFGELDSGKAFGFAQIIMRVLGIAIIGFLLYFIIRYILMKDGTIFWGKKNKKINITEVDIHENIHEINFAETIFKLERERDYRSAIRYRFLKFLKELTDKKLINWNIEKTNRDYARELKNESQKTTFAELAYIFDYVWYGEFDINEEDYQYFKLQFEKAKF